MQRRDDGKVIADFGVVKNAFGRLDVVAFDRRGRVRCQVRHAAGGEHRKGLLNHRHVIFGQRARVGARVGQRFVALVQALGQRQRGFGRKAEFAIGLALQRGQIEQQARRLRCGARFFRHRGALAAHGVGNGACLRFAPDAVGFQFRVRLGAFRAGGVIGRGGIGGAGSGVSGLRSIGGSLFPCRIKPFARIEARFGGKSGVDFPVVAADELADFFLALDHHRQRGRLHPAHGRQKETAVARIERRHGARAVDAH